MLAVKVKINTQYVWKSEDVENVGMILYTRILLSIFTKHFSKCYTRIFY